MVQGDVRDPAVCREACEGAQIVIHCVAQVPLARHKDLLWSVNRDGTKNLLEAARGADVEKLIYISSSAVFGVPDHVPVTEETKPVPAEDYGAAKLKGETICRDYVDKGMDVTIIRPRTIMGHGRLGIMQVVFEWVSQGHNVFVLGKGDNRYQFVHADDLADACLKAADRPGFAVYNIGAEKFGTMRETLEGLCEHAGTGSKVRGLPYRPAIFGMMLTSKLGLSPLVNYHWLAYGKNIYFDLAKAKSELDYEPKWGNVEMFCQSYDWYVAHRERILAEKGKSLHRSPVKAGVLRLLRWI
jgi:nucleoside-diphosphate-sugar epimerase